MRIYYIFLPSWVGGVGVRLPVLGLYQVLVVYDYFFCFVIYCLLYKGFCVIIFNNKFPLFFAFVSFHSMSSDLNDKDKREGKRWEDNAHYWDSQKGNQKDFKKIMWKGMFGITTLPIQLINYIIYWITLWSKLSTLKCC